VEIDPTRLRRGEWIVGASAVVLLASMFALDWFGRSGAPSSAASTPGVPTTVNGWDGLTNLRWLMLIAIACSFLLVFFQAVRSSPAVPVAFSVIVSVLAVLTALALIYRVLINEPDGYVDQKAGAFVGLLSSLVLVYGGYESMRQEGIAPRDAIAPSDIEAIRLPSTSGS